MSSCADVLSSHALEGLTRCEFARQFCDADEGILHYSSTYYCADGDFGRALFVAFLAAWLSLLFLLLGSTADDYFSPSLEQFTEKLGLPPRFAGVTLLALGNGAPDVSSTVAAINSGKDGYLLSLGALTGAGVFVGTVVAGSVMVAAGGVCSSSIEESLSRSDFLSWMAVFPDLRRLFALLSFGGCQCGDASAIDRCALLLVCVPC